MGICDLSDWIQGLILHSPDVVHGQRRTGSTFIFTEKDFACNTVKSSPALEQKEADKNVKKWLQK